MNCLEKLRGGLIVSCQAREGEPLHGAAFMAAMAEAAELGGAAGIRADNPVNIQAIRQVTQLPIIGSYKIYSSKTEVYVTPTFDSAKMVIEAGANIVALDATSRPRGNEIDVSPLIKQIKKELNALILADISILEEANVAVDAGADFVSTALSGYTSYSKETSGFNFDMLSWLVKEINFPIIAEGFIATPGEAGRTLKLGAFAVVVGTAITRPQEITARFAAEIKESVKTNNTKK